MASLDEVLAALEGFQWDTGNSDKNWRRHRVSQIEAEQIFFNRPLVVPVPGAAGAERRFVALGRSDSGRELTAVFTIRGRLIRVVSARPMSRRERRIRGQVDTQED